MSELRSIVERVVRIANKHELMYVIVGGVAAIFRGKARTTMDVDIIIDDDMVKTILFLESLKHENFEVPMEQARMSFQMNENVSVFDKESILRLDLKVARNPDELNVLENATVESIQDIPMRIATPEDILYGKIWFLGDISDLDDAELLEFNDVLDFINVFEANRDLDLKKLQKMVKQKGFESTLDRILGIIKKKHLG